MIILLGKSNYGGRIFSTIVGFNSGSISKDKEGATTEPEKKLNSSENLEADEKEKDNELIYEVSGEKKTVPAEIHSLSSLGKEINASENFGIIEDPSGLHFLKSLYSPHFFLFLVGCTEKKKRNPKMKIYRPLKLYYRKALQVQKVN